MKTNSFQFISRHRDHLLQIISVLTLLFSVSAFLFYVKDDTYITFRFSRNLVEWGEIAFNRGVRVEGYTNFLWMIILTIPAMLKTDMVIFAKTVSLLFSAGAVYFVWKISSFLNKDTSDGYLSSFSSAMIFASGTSLALWTMSGLENGLFMFLILAGIYYTASSKKIFGAVFLTLSCMTRPEGHLFLIAGAGIIAIRTFKERRITKQDIIWALIPFTALGIYHVFRYTYFGSLMPNTFLVKGSPRLDDVFRINTVNGFSIEGASVEYIKGFLDFNFNKFPVLLSFAALMTRDRKRLLMNLFFLLIVAAFFIYHIRIGRDSMIFYRLFLPAMPFIAILSVEGIKNIASLVQIPHNFSRFAPIVLTVPLCAGMLLFTHADENSFLNSYMDKSQRSHQELGHYLNEHAKQGETVAFQDMGGTPYIAKEISFFDTIGIVDPWMGKELGKIKYNPFLRNEKMNTPAGKAEILEFSSKFRDHLFNEVDPERVVFIAYSPKPDGKNMSEALKSIDTNLIRNRNVRPEKYSNELVIDENSAKTAESLFAPYLAGNKYYHGLYSDSRFSNRYKLESYWRRTEGYWIVLFKKFPL